MARCIYCRQECSEKSCAPCRRKAADAKAAERAARRSAGLCVDCKAVTVGTSIYCAGCREYHRLSSLDQKHNRRDEGRCVGCGVAFGGVTWHCPPCLSKIAKRRKELREQRREAMQ